MYAMGIEWTTGYSQCEPQVLCEQLLVLCVVCAGYEIPQRLKKAAFEGALAISKKKKAAKGKDWSEMICRTECVIIV